MTENNVSKLKTKMILTALETDTQSLADEIGEQRPVVSGVISGTRKAKRVRQKLADAIARKVTDIICPSEEKAA